MTKSEWEARHKDCPWYSSEDVTEQGRDREELKLCDGTGGNFMNDNEVVLICDYETCPHVFWSSKPWEKHPLMTSSSSSSSWGNRKAIIDVKDLKSLPELCSIADDCKPPYNHCKHYNNYSGCPKFKKDRLPGEALKEVLKDYSTVDHTESSSIESLAAVKDHYLNHEKLLGNTLQQVMKKVGVLRQDALCTGPELLVAVEGYLETPAAYNSREFKIIKEICLLSIDGQKLLCQGHTLECVISQNMNKVEVKYGCMCGRVLAERKEED